MKCPACNQELVKPLPTICPHCGADLSLNVHLRQLCRDVKRNYRLGWLGLGIIFLVALITLLFRGPKPYPPSSQNHDSVNILQGKIAALEDSLARYKQRFEAPSEASQKSEEEYVIQPGDNLWLIAQKLLGDGKQYSRIANDNQISDPSFIQVGQKIKIKKQNGGL